MVRPFSIDHAEGDIISIVFVDARKPETVDLVGPEISLDFVKQYTIGVLLQEDGMDNSIDGSLPGLVGLWQKRKPLNTIYFMKLPRGSEIQTLYQLGGQGVGVSEMAEHLAMPRQVIVGRLGLIYYIGPLLSDDDFAHKIATHI